MHRRMSKVPAWKLRPIKGGTMEEDRAYRNFEKLSQHETENIDFRIVKRFVPVRTIGAIVPHGGKIEFLTPELAD